METQVFDPHRYIGRVDQRYHGRPCRTPVVAPIGRISVCEVDCRLHRTYLTNRSLGPLEDSFCVEIGPPVGQSPNSPSLIASDQERRAYRERPYRRTGTMLTTDDSCG